MSNSESICKAGLPTGPQRGLEPWAGPLWDAINRYAISCGGDPSKHIGSPRRMQAVADVERIVRGEA